MSRNKAIWLAKLLFRRGQLSRQEILDAWATWDEEGQAMASSTFYDNRRLLQERYGINIRVDNGLYSLELREGREQEFLRRLFSGEDDGDAGDTIIQEPRPAGHAMIAAVSRSMERRTSVEIAYSPFDKPPYSTVFSPYCLRIFRGRCYTVGYSSLHRETRIFALDRITSLTPTASPFPRAPRFDAREYFKYSFGVYGGMNQRPERVIIEADGRNAAFLRSLPLHASQKESPTGDARYPWRFEMELCVSADLVRELLYYGAGIRVVAPLSLRQRINDEAHAMLAAYGENNDE